MKYTEKDLIKLEIRRYKPDKLSGNLALLAVVFNILYFVCLYKVEAVTVYTILLGVSVVYNLLFMLATFFSSIEVKMYNKKFAIFLIIIGVFQVVRMFLLPARFLAMNTADVTVLSNDIYAKMIIYLAVSAALLVAAGVIGLINSVNMRNYKKYLSANPTNVNKGEALCQI